LVLGSSPSVRAQPIPEQAPAPAEAAPVAGPAPAGPADQAPAQPPADGAQHQGASDTAPPGETTISPIPPPIEAAPAPAPTALPPEANEPPLPADTVEEPPADAAASDVAPIAGDPWGAGPGGAQVGFINLRLLLQTRVRGTFASASNSDRVSYRVIEDNIAQDHDGWNLNRLFLRIGAEPSEYLELKTIVDLAELVHDNADSAVKQGYATLKPWPKRLEFTAGLFKLPFSILELDPIANYELAELGQADDLVKDLGFAGRDIGAEVAVAPLSKPKHLRVAVGLFRGHSHDEHDSLAGAIGARIESQPIKGLRLGIDWVEHPQKVMYQQPLETSNKAIVPNPLDPMYPRQRVWDRGRAFSADASFNRYHIALRVEAMAGTRVDYDTRYGAHSFAAIWALAGYRFRTGPIHLMPVVRAEWLDTDREHDTGLRRELSFALNVDFSKSVRLLLDVTRTDVQSSTPLFDQPRPLPETPYDELDNTRLVGQLQVKI
jgi:hypothetical protein